MSNDQECDTCGAIFDDKDAGDHRCPMTRCNLCEKPIEPAIAVDYDGSDDWAAVPSDVRVTYERGYDGDVDLVYAHAGCVAKSVAEYGVEQAARLAEYERTTAISNCKHPGFDEAGNCTAGCGGKRHVVVR